MKKQGKRVSNRRATIAQRRAAAKRSKRGPTAGVELDYLLNPSLFDDEFLASAEGQRHVAEWNATDVGRKDFRRFVERREEIRDGE